uniref:Uncharacterized protein n=1 Tax=Rhizophora mucronata TaxID=61149 RepID=A0A2P2JM11_RHIMU
MVSIYIQEYIAHYNREYIAHCHAPFSVCNDIICMQVAVSLAACIYFLNEKTKSLGRAFILGLGALATGWVCGSICVPMIPTVLIHPTWTLELMTSLVAYFFLFLGCTFLK